MALKTMSGIRVPVIAQIVSLAIKKGVVDLSPLVRKAAALACVKLVRLDPSAKAQAEEFVGTLLRDRQYYVAGAAVQAFGEVCPERLELVHPVFRRLCGMVVDMDEWGQLAVVGLGIRYSRLCFPRRWKRVRKAEMKTRTQEEKARDFYQDLDEPHKDAEERNDEDAYEHQELPDPDLTLFLTSIVPLLHSRNSAVILAVARAYLHLSPTTHLPAAIGPLIALLRSPADLQQLALQSIVHICLHHPQHFTPYIRHFLLKASEPASVWKPKLEILTLLFPHAGKEMQALILAELEHFSHSHEAEVVRESVKGIGRCASSSASSGTFDGQQTARRCLRLLLKQIHSPDQHLVGEAVEVVRHLIQRSPDEHRKTVVRLAKNLDTLTSPTARASVVWLVGEFAAAGDGSETGEVGGGSIAADVLRILVKGYADEGEEVRGQIVLLAARVYLHHLNAKNTKAKALDALNTPHNQDTYAFPQDDSNNDQTPFTEPSADPDPIDPIEVLYTHTLTLAHYTPSYALRDRARTYRASLSTPSSTDLASLLLLAPKPVPVALSPSEGRRDAVLGGVGMVVGGVGRGLGGDGFGGGGQGGELPEWVKEGEEPDPRLRDEEGGDGGAAAAAAALGKGGVVSAGQRLDEALRAESSYAPAKGKAVGGGGVGGRKEKTLDDWLEEESVDGSSEGSEEEETETETEGEYESESESEEEEEDEKAGLMR